jgi:hypothetical protein
MKHVAVLPLSTVAFRYQVEHYISPSSKDLTVRPRAGSIFWILLNVENADVRIVDQSFQD